MNSFHNETCETLLTNALFLFWGFRVAVVTGGNKGIGFEICRQLASNGLEVILTARDEKRGLDAVDSLKGSGLVGVGFHQLDVTDPVSVASLANFIESHFGKLDILVEPYNMAEDCLKTNFYGVKHVTEALLSLLHLSDSPRIVNISSLYGLLSFIPNERIRQKLDDTDSLTEDDLDEVTQSFLSDFKGGLLETNGWPTSPSAYKISKAVLNAYTRILAKKQPKVIMNCVHPGFVKTDMTLNLGVFTPEEGARGPMKLALLPNDSPSGLFFDQTELSTF
ncbi:Salutaridine reductase [Acorus gramineus]|uniref:Salutaridine reductase n=1 Tax=Acorus gramineus TaxID=55184 RepID=A0AAV9ATJ9_ACOGR|nr:Salutaridine reductase [Acorus gramineus]